MRTWPLNEKIGAADVHDAVVIPIMTEQCLAKTEKTRSGLAIIFEHNGFRHLRKYPIKARRDAIATTHVVLVVIAPHLTGPVDAFDYAARFGASRGLLLRARAIGNNEQLRGPRLPNALEHASRQVGALEY
jgi:hypothetical protein